MSQVKQLWWVKESPPTPCVETRLDVVESIAWAIHLARDLS